MLLSVLINRLGSPINHCCRLEIPGVPSENGQ
jgi:hypothetical protein